MDTVLGDRGCRKLIILNVKYSLLFCNYKGHLIALIFAFLEDDNDDATKGVKGRSAANIIVFVIIIIKRNQPRCMAIV